MPNPSRETVCWSVNFDQDRNPNVFWFGSRSERSRIRTHLKNRNRIQIQIRIKSFGSPTLRLSVLRIRVPSDPKLKSIRIRIRIDLTSRIQGSNKNFFWSCQKQCFWFRSALKLTPWIGIHIRIRDADSGSGSRSYKITKKLENIEYFLQDFFDLFWRTLSCLNFVSDLRCYGIN